MSKNLICILDKEYPPEHSFVDGMLAGELPLAGVKVFLLVSKGKGKKKVYKYKKAICLPVLFSRKGLLRFFNVIILFYYLFIIIKRCESSKSTTSLYVRNEPAYLVAACFYKVKVNKIIYHSSFPHEIGNIFNIKKSIAIVMMKLLASYVDVVIAVSAQGLKRLRTYFKSKAEGLVIPLLGSDTEYGNADLLFEKFKDDESIKFVYIGTHNIKRKINIIMNSILIAHKSCPKTLFYFIGGLPSDLLRLRKDNEVRSLEKSGIITFIDRLSRKTLLEELKNYHIGICLIPPDRMYLEASPTKLAEYMWSGLAVIANIEIPFQSKVIKESGCGALTSWSEKEIANTITTMCSNRNRITEMKSLAFKYAQKELNYKNYVLLLKELL